MEELFGGFVATFEACNSSVVDGDGYFAVVAYLISNWQPNP